MNSCREIVLLPNNHTTICYSSIEEYKMTMFQHLCTPGFLTVCVALQSREEQRQREGNLRKLNFALKSSLTDFIFESYASLTPAHLRTGLRLFKIFLHCHICEAKTAPYRSLTFFDSYLVDCIGLSSEKGLKLHLTTVQRK